MGPSLSIIICSLNGAERIKRCLRAVSEQTIAKMLQVIVVDDGSSDSTGDIALARGATVVRHATTRGASAARNSGVEIASAPFVAFLDDDCAPEPGWAEELMRGFDHNVLALGGPLIVGAGAGIIIDYLVRHNPLDPQELDLAKSTNLIYRLYLYIRQQWRPLERLGRREVFSLPSANLAVRRKIFVDVGGFDERIRYGGEDDDLCRRLLRAHPEQHLIFDPSARVVHYFKPSLRDTLRRSRLYGRGSALMYRKWPDVRPTFFPFPVFVVIILLMSFIFPGLAALIIVMPHLLYPRGLRAALAGRNVLCVLDPYIQLAQECCDDLGFIEGLWRFRNFPTEPPAKKGQELGLW